MSKYKIRDQFGLNFITDRDVSGYFALAQRNILRQRGQTSRRCCPSKIETLCASGDARIFQLRRKAVPTESLNYVLTSGSLIYMPASIQEEWQHAVPKVVSERGRISMTFRKMKSS